MHPLFILFIFCVSLTFSFITAVLIGIILFLDFLKDYESNKENKDKKIRKILDKNTFIVYNR